MKHHSKKKSKYKKAIEEYLRKGGRIETLPEEKEWNILEDQRIEDITESYQFEKRKIVEDEW